MPDFNSYEADSSTITILTYTLKYNRNLWLLLVMKWDQDTLSELAFVLEHGLHLKIMFSSHGPVESVFKIQGFVYLHSHTFIHTISHTHTHTQHMALSDKDLYVTGETFFFDII